MVFYSLYCLLSFLDTYFITLDGNTTVLPHSISHGYLLFTSNSMNSNGSVELKLSLDFVEYFYLDLSYLAWIKALTDCSTFSILTVFSSWESYICGQQDLQLQHFPNPESLIFQLDAPNIRVALPFVGR